MDVKKVLESHKVLDFRIQLQLDEIAQLRAVAEHARSMPYSESRKIGTHSDRVADYAIRIADLEAELDKHIDRLVELKERIIAIASSLDDATERIVIERVYILRETKEVVAEKMNYSVRQIARLQKSALEKLQVLYSDIDINDFEVN